MWPNPQFLADLVTFTEEIFNGKPHFLCSEMISTAKLPILKNSMVTKGLALLLSQNIKPFTNFFGNQAFLGINLWMCKIINVRRCSKKVAILEKHKDTFSKHTHKDKLPLTARETELGYHRYRWKVRVSPRVVKQLKP